MQTIRERGAFAQQRGLFRAASAASLTRSMLSALMSPCCKTLWRPSSTFKFLPQVSYVDFFISHSRACSSWLKLMVLCHYLNLDLAIALSFIAVAVAVIFLIVYTGSVLAVAELSPGFLYVCFYVWPVTVFLAAYFGGHLCSRKLFWFDQLCIDQEDLLLKAQCLQAIPAFVAHSKKMIILFDETYFGRLWCIYELAVHAKAAKATNVADEDQIAELIPVWMPLWVICWLCLQSLQGLFVGEPMVPEFDTKSRASFFISTVTMNFPPLWQYPLIGLVGAWFSFGKLKRHRTMLDQMKDFDVRNAKCSLETDRTTIQEQVVSLFDEAFEPPLSVAFGSEIDADESLDALIDVQLMRDIRHVTSYPSNEQILDQFNAYVRGPLRDSVLRSAGKEDFISFKLCFVAGLPWLYFSLTYILPVGCDGLADCSLSASRSGYSSVSQYILSNFIFCWIVTPLGMTLYFTPMLIACRWTTELGLDAMWQWTLASCLCAIVSLLGDLLLNVMRGLLMVVVAKFSFVWLGAFLAGLGLECGLCWFLFHRKQPAPTQRMLVR
eukprot:Skav206470  [mRNA]  locus=scaffold1672:114166:115818:+ [translate_table: standard]